MQVHHVTLYGTAELRAFLGDGLDGSSRRMAQNHKRIFSIVDEPPLWSDADDSLESMSDPEEDEGDMPDDKDSTRSGVGEGHADAG